MIAHALLMATLATAPDRARDDVLALSTATYVVGSWSTLFWYYGASNGLGGCASRPSCQERTDPIGPQLAYYGAMVVLPALPRIVVGDTKGTLAFAAANAAALLAGKWIDGFGPPALGTAAGFLLATTVGVTELVTTPHREDLRPAPAVSPIVLRDGAGLAWSGVW